MSLNLGDDVITCILSKLPVESLQRFKIVQKSWCSIINDPNFIKLHIDDSSSDINRQKILLISSKITPSPCLEYNMLAFNIGATCASSLSVNSQVVSLIPPNYFMSRDISYPLVSSCNGLLCMVYSFTIFIWNPAVRKYKTVQKPDHYVSMLYGYESTLYGFVYDSSCDDYKIIAIFEINAKDSHYIVGIYSVNNEFWKKIDSVPAGYRLFDENPVSLDGTINMMATRSGQENVSSVFNKFVIISLFVADEKFVVTPVPLQYHGNRMKLYNFANRLYLSVFVETDFLVCSLEKAGERWTWTNVMKIPILPSFFGIGENKEWYLDDIICLKEKNNILWRKTNGDFLEYNVWKQEVNEFTLNQISPATDSSILFAGSLANLRIPWD